MGSIAKLLSFIRLTRNDAKVSDVKVDTGGGPNITVEHFADAGDDSFPLPTDYVQTVSAQGTGRQSAVGYLDPINTPKAEQGDKRIYARDADTGAVVVEVWLKNDGSGVLSNANGSVTLRPDGGVVMATPLSSFDADADGSIAGTNGAGSFELTAGGDFVVNGVTIDTSGNITTPTTLTAATVAAVTSLTVAGVEAGGHTHTQGNDSNDDTQDATDPMV